MGKAKGPTVKLPDPLESDIQIQLVECLRLVPPARGVLFFSSPNEGMGKAKGGGGIARMVRLKRMGLLPGVSDLIFVRDGKAYFLELKRRTGKQSTAQLTFEADAIRAGAAYAVARSVDEALEILRSWGIVA